MSKRRDALKAMLTPIAIPPTDDDHPVRQSGVSGSLKAMGLTLKNLSDEADEARALKAQLATGARVVELDPNLVDPSFVRDRLAEPEGEAFEVFKAGLAADGQQVPILVRPAPNAEGRFQAAYGHRRLAALRALGQPVKAIVRELTDEQLIVAQGKENSDRRDLSFIERALFAARLEDRGFSRAALTAALSLQKGNLSTMISVARGVPESLIVAIGPAPKVGRPRWEQLAALVTNDAGKWRTAISDPAFVAAESDARFDYVLRALVQRPEPPAPDIVRGEDGTLLAAVNHGKGRIRLTIESRHVPEFGDWLVAQLPEIYAAFQRRADA
ncbi:MAG: plasmid partitioning protein RepB [Hyphomicrobiales bacterium]|nr:plasmid partitioning protein RepB [Hyphomicrobiales bacterium]